MVQQQSPDSISRILRACGQLQYFKILQHGCFTHVQLSTTEDQDNQHGCKAVKCPPHPISPRVMAKKNVMMSTFWIENCVKPESDKNMFYSWGIAFTRMRLTGQRHVKPHAISTTLIEQIPQYNHAIFIWNIIVPVQSLQVVEGKCVSQL